jgi:hypothetical protein
MSTCVGVPCHETHMSVEYRVFLGVFFLMSANRPGVSPDDHHVEMIDILNKKVHRVVEREVKREVAT